MPPIPADNNGPRRVYAAAAERVSAGRVSQLSSSFDPRVSTFMNDRGDEDLVDFCSAFSRRRRYHLSGGCMGTALILMLAAVGR